VVIGLSIVSKQLLSELNTRGFQSHQPRVLVKGVTPRGQKTYRVTAWTGSDNVWVRCLLRAMSASGWSAGRAHHCHTFDYQLLYVEVYRSKYTRCNRSHFGVIFFIRIAAVPYTKFPNNMATKCCAHFSDITHFT